MSENKLPSRGVHHSEEIIKSTRWTRERDIIFIGQRNSFANSFIDYSITYRQLASRLTANRFQLPFPMMVFSWERRTNWMLDQLEFLKPKASRKFEIFSIINASRKGNITAMFSRISHSRGASTEILVLISVHNNLEIAVNCISFLVCFASRRRIVCHTHSSGFFGFKWL